jgi:ADP-ribosylglycohydrolase
MKNKIQATLLGLAIGDAMGVPVEFVSREILKKDSIIDFRGFGTHSQVAGTFSDDSSLCFCLVESLIENYWTANGNVFDCGITIAEALEKLKNNHSPKYSGSYTEKSNGNGSLMRIIPLVFYIIDKPVEYRYEMVKEISSLTHAHQRSILACFYLTEFAIEIMNSNDLESAFVSHIDKFKNHCILLGLNNQEFQYFNRLFDYDFAKVK